MHATGDERKARFMRPLLALVLPCTVACAGVTTLRAGADSVSQFEGMDAQAARPAPRSAMDPCAEGRLPASQDASGKMRHQPRLGSRPSAPAPGDGLWCPVAQPVDRAAVAKATDAPELAAAANHAGTLRAPGVDQGAARDHELRWTLTDVRLSFDAGAPTP
jgi:hypothetical protein